MKVLIVNTVSFKQHGLLSVIYNYCSNMDRDGIEFTFTATNDVEESLREQFAPLGRIVRVPSRRGAVMAYLRAVDRLMAEERFDVVHIHGNSGTMLLETLLAKLRGVKKVIVHGHTTKTNHPFANAVLKYPMIALADELVACTDAAGNWLYGNREFTTLNNAIDLSRFSFNADLRKQYREMFGVTEEFLVGHVGHFVSAKNHLFLIDVFAQLHTMEPNSKLLLIGDGELMNEVRETVVRQNLQDAVIFAGKRSDVAAIYNAMDLFLMPSLWEGLPLVTAEAQANSLPALVSNAVPRKAKGSEYLLYKDLSDGAGQWAEEILAIRSKNLPRNEDTHIGLAQIGFDIRVEAEKLRKIYRNEGN